MAYAHAFDQIKVSTGEDVSQLMRAIPSVKLDDITMLNATEIGKHLNMNAKTVNITLCEIGMIYKDDNKKWRLTEAGTAFGEMKPFHRNGHSDYEIRWKESVVDVLLNHLTQPSD
ncbi:hypothetical protein W03_09530 [Nitrosomonas sp. PY1]|uniref:hypothetical protein n=1 Tax=Nitrosomonas sp. PY1 TaxID=1803906 RepID=UPI001FC832B2|nr:hypothetical protein [Nitrosomonas sp. PY1]GKS68949.1 hypothetical protein W03_09530 [Nitrosomonas sp. PY1]